MDELVDNKNMRKSRLIDIFDNAKIVEFSDQTDQNRRQIVIKNCTGSNKCRTPSVNIVIITIFITIPFILFVIMLLFYHFVQYE
uniref:ODV-E56 n=1 Tax=Globodera pallida TaxID=36090 RepID=A0A183BVX6_GLOPA